MPAAAVLGTGLIGASVGIGLRASGWSVAGWDPSPDALATAARIGAVDRAAAGPGPAIGGADLVVLAAPVGQIVATLAGLSTEALVTDVGGVKTAVVEAAAHLPHFVGGHPMAGRETSGPEGASGSMFRGATWVLVTDRTRPADLATMEAVVAGLGAIPLRMTAADHDRAVAAASHLPHVTAAGLLEAVAADPGALALAAGGFRDLTRVAMSQPGWWVDVLVNNRPAVAGALRQLAASLQGWADAVEAGDGGEIERRLDEARRVRASMAAPVATVAVLVEDRPGEIARIGHSLSASGVDLRDLQLRHATHGGGGVLTLSVRAGEQQRLLQALEADGFRVLSASG
jgi:prephenate dehydrogenase